MTRECTHAPSAHRRTVMVKVHAKPDATSALDCGCVAIDPVCGQYWITMENLIGEQAVQSAPDRPTRPNQSRPTPIQAGPSTTTLAEIVLQHPQEEDEDVKGSTAPGTERETSSLEIH